MLKLTYTENGFCLERLNESLEAWVADRILLCLRASTSIYVEPSTASFFLPANLSCLVELRYLEMKNKEILAVEVCDIEEVEVSLYGTWVSATEDSEEGIFVCAMTHQAESFLERVWYEASLGASVINE